MEGSEERIEQPVDVGEPAHQVGGRGSVGTARHQQPDLLVRRKDSTVEEQRGEDPTSRDLDGRKNEPLGTTINPP